MRKILNTWRFVRVVNDLAQTRDEHRPAEHSLSNYQIWHPTGLAAKMEYVRKYRRTKHFQTNGICADAIKAGYLEGHTEVVDELKIDILCLTSEGRGLIDRFLFVPWGLLRALTHIYGSTLSLLIALGLGVFVSWTLSLLKALTMIILRHI